MMLLEARRCFQSCRLVTRLDCSTQDRRLQPPELPASRQELDTTSTASEGHLIWTPLSQYGRFADSCGQPVR